MSYRVPDCYVLRTDNPNATITSNLQGLPVGFNNRHRLSGSKVATDVDLTLEALSQCHYQTAEEAYADIAQHKQVLLGETLHVKVHVDKHGKVGVQTLPEYAIRKPGTIRSLLTTNGYPRPQSAVPCDLTEGDIAGIVLGAIEQGIPFSYSVVRPKFGQHRSGDILIFWPSHAPFYGAAACDKLGTCVEMDSYTTENPLDPRVIHVCIPWLSEEYFGGTYQICCGSGRKRLLVVNGGWYDGGCKKPITFQANDRRLPRHSPYIVTHWAMTGLLNNLVIAIGTTTAAGKTEGSSDEANLDTPGSLFWEHKTTQLEVPIGKGSALARINHARGERGIYSDDITAVATDFDGVPHGVELEQSHFNRIDLCTGEGTLPIAENSAKGKVAGRVYWYNVDFDEQAQEFIPWSHHTLDGRACTNPRLSYEVTSNPDFVGTTPHRPKKIDVLILSIPVPEIPEGWNMPTIVRVSVAEFLVNNCHGARANHGNPALGSIGNGYWAFEGFGGKAGFTLDAQAEMLARDLKFWESLKHDTPCFIVFNGYSMGMKQRFKYSATYLLRALLEHWKDDLLSAPLLNLPGVFTGGVPDLSSFLPNNLLDPRVWDPRTLEPKRLHADTRTWDTFGYNALNEIHGQHGLGPGSTTLLGDLMRRYSLGCRS